MSENTSHVVVKMGSERNFGIVFAIFFAIIAFLPTLKGQPVLIWACGLSIAFLFAGLFFPKILTIPNRVWFKFGLLLGGIVAPVVMTILFILTVVPIGLIMRLAGKDLLGQKIDKAASSYWLERPKSDHSMKNQF
ncbi:SxtJ family membrane protein [Terasakiella brassicae]|nr:SxtJ family membrane protein [Terasakiella brassicae]